ncbi:MAG: GGDEF domain-containing protein [Pyrinomonadaceae bacterium]
MKIKTNTAVYQAVVIIFALAFLFAATLIFTNPWMRTAIFAAVAAALSAMLLVRKEVFSEDESEKSQVREDAVSLEKELEMLEHAAVFFSASLRAGEMLRLLEARLDAVDRDFSFRFWRPSDSMTGVVYAGDSVSGRFPAPAVSEFLITLASKASAGKRFISSADAGIEEVEARDMYGAAIPLLHGQDVFCVMTVFSNVEQPGFERCELVAGRIGPLLSGSMAFESSISNALTDGITNLPNERALFLVLENQIAECRRFPDERIISVLALDIVNFDAVNQQFGHVEGDRLLRFASEVLKSELRKMDFLSRSSNDEFLAVLSTLSSAYVENVAARLKQRCESDPYALPGGEKLFLDFNIGFSTFGGGNESASEMIRLAVEQKEVAKSAAKGSVLLFPTVV